MDNQLIVIDEVKTKVDQTQNDSDLLSIEWFEIRKQKITRKTKTGLTLELRLQNRNEWQNGDRLLFENNEIATVYIKPALCIQFVAESMSDAADFCYFVGNRHLPIYTCHTNQHQLLMPYDGRMYEQLSERFPTKINLIEEQLLNEFLLKKVVNN
ncbi:urease accessory protein UreE [Chishuiella sp.]|uniref:urease accessory protein UreE n=1 Tax=Chishuiella sp. TaxID=1969467 RepID=UPI0028AA7605|nr:urease accessory protein UreE [Chishuiella sp.]